MQLHRPHGRTMVRRVVASLVAALALTLLVLACGESPGNGGPTPTGDISVTVNVVGNGRVVSSAIGLNCGGTCTVTVAEGSTVALTGAALSGQVLAGWDGPCEPLAETCTWTATEDVEVTATFAPHALRFDLQGDGEGFFHIAGGGIDTECRDACFVPVQSVQPLALALTYESEGSRTELGPWTGACAASTRLDYCVVQVEGLAAVGKTWLHPPRITAEHDYVTNQETPLVVGASQGLLRGVDDTPGDTHVASRVSGPANGSVDIAPNGAFTYTPNVGFTGIDSFEYRVKDAIGNTDTGEASVAVWARLTLTTSGAGSVTSEPEGIACGPSCDTEVAHFAIGTEVTLTAEPAADSEFVGWTGAACGAEPTSTCTFTVVSAVSVGATFTPRLHELTVTTTGSGGGNVTSSPSGIDLDGGEASASFTHGTFVTLTADPATSSEFSGWTAGPCSGTSLTCAFTITGDTTVTARFTLRLLALAVDADGDGNVTSEPSGIDLAVGEASTEFAYGTSVTLAAAPATGYGFVAWDGGTCSGDTTDTCTFSITSDESVTAVFASDPE